MSEIKHQIVEKKQIIKAVLFALTLSILVLVSAVLPAEYGIDPIGTGKLLGFSKLHVGEDTASESEPTVQKAFPLIKMEKAGSGPDVKRPIEADNPAPEKQFTVREDTVEVIVPAGKGIEYKIYMLKYGNMKYEWSTEKGKILYFDFHGEVKQAKEVSDVYYESYTLAYSNNMVGTFYAPYEGKHGWYFLNDEDKDIVVTLKLKGQYSI